jgi:hypothetical protein
MQNAKVARQLLATAIVACVMGCAPSAVQSSPSSGSPLAAMSPSGATAEPSVTATAEPSIEASPTATTKPQFAPDSIAVTVSDRLLVRSKPGVGKDSQKLAPLLPLGTRLFVIKGPVPASGYDWYLVQPLRGAGPAGWVAAGDRGGEPWLDVAAVSCPSRPDLVTIAAIDPNIALACYGAEELKFPGRLGAFDGLSCPDLPPFGWAIDPSWLDPCSVMDSLFPVVGEPEPGYFDATFDPTIDRGAIPAYGDNLEIWTRVEVTGQYDHPAARTCRGRTKSPGLRPPRPEVVVLVCRSRFVITSIHVVGGA